MNQLPPQFNVQRPLLTHATAVHTLLITTDIAEYGEPDTDLEDVQYDWDRIDLNKDAWLVWHDDDLVGYAVVTHFGDEYETAVAVHPDYQSYQLDDYLLGECLNRLDEMRHEADVAEISTKRYVNHWNKAECTATERAGFTVRKFHLRMQIELDEQPAPAQFPQGLELRTMVPKQDDLPVYDFIKSVFERDGRPYPSFDEWAGFMMRPDHFYPDLWFLLWHNDEIIGAALCFDYELYGWVRQLGVARAWRRQGIAKQLLQHSFRIFYERDRPRVGLGVEGTNEKAYALYEQIGMQRVRQYDEYFRIIKE